MSNKKLHIVDDTKTNLLTSKLNTNDYFMMHRAELMLIKSNNDNYKKFVFWFDKIGALCLGFVLNSIFNGTFILNFKEYIWPIICGLVFIGLSIYYHYAKEKNIDEALQRTLKEVDNKKPS
jgi:hypothetical protein